MCFSYWICMEFFGGLVCYLDYGLVLTGLWDSISRV